MSEKRKKSEKKSDLIPTLISALKVDEAQLKAIATLEKTLMIQKANKESAKQKVTRQKMRAKKFYRNEYSLEILIALQKYASTL